MEFTYKQANQYILMELQENIMNFLISAKSKYIAKQLHEICILNQRILNCNTPTFIYKGNRYAAFDYPRQKDENRLLDATLRERVYHILSDDNFEDMSRQVYLRAYVFKVLLFSTNAKNIYSILPKQLHEVCQKTFRLVNDAIVYPIKSDEAVNTFIAQNTQGANLLKSYLMTNLLLLD